MCPCLIFASWRYAKNPQTTPMATHTQQLRSPDDSRRCHVWRPVADLRYFQMLAPVRYLISVLVWPTSARQVWVFSRSKIMMARMQSTNDPIGTRINKRIIAVTGIRMPRRNQPADQDAGEKTRKGPSNDPPGKQPDRPQFVPGGHGHSLPCRESDRGLRRKPLLVVRGRPQRD